MHYFTNFENFPRCDTQVRSNNCKRVWFRALYLTNTIELLLEPIILSVSTPRCIILQILKFFPAVPRKLDQIIVKGRGLEPSI